MPVWGTAEPGEMVTVSFGAQTKSAKADANGAWLFRRSLLRYAASDDFSPKWSVGPDWLDGFLFGKSKEKDSLPVRLDADTMDMLN